MKLVWYVYAQAREVHVHTSLQDSVIVNEHESLDGGALLPGFQLLLEELFSVPQPPRS